jgi:ribosomal protein L14E/L6E/L27E
MNDNRLEYIKEFNDSIFNNDVIKKKNILVFIYTPPKVGSTTLVTSFRISCARKVNVLHIHDENMLSIITGIKNNNNVTVIELINYNASIGKTIYIIDVYRSPIERKISEYFELLTSYHFNTSDNNIVNYKIELLIKRFNSLFYYLGTGDYFFDKYDINIPDSFDFDKKFLLVEKNNVKYIKLRLCDSNEWGTILSNILNMEIVIVKDYQTENKFIGEVYRKFNEEYKIPYNLLETVVQCKYFNYYNSENEKQNYLSNWELKKSMIFVEPFSLEKYNFYKEISIENQYYNVIQRNHYLDHGCICNTCCYKRRQIFLAIKNGENVNDLKIIHEEAVQEKKHLKLQRIKVTYEKIVDNLKKISKNQNRSKIHNTFEMNIK